MRGAAVFGAVAVALCGGSAGVRPEVHGSFPTWRQARQQIEARKPVLAEADTSVPVSSSLAEETGNYEHGWDRSPGTYLTNYAIFVTCIVLRIMAFFVRRKITDEDARRVLFIFMAYADWTGASFLFGGIVHHMIAIYWKSETNHALGVTWGSPNSGFLYPWMASVVLSPLATGAGAALLAACTRAQGNLGYAVYGIIISVSVAVSMWQAMHFVSSSVAIYLGAVFSIVAAVAALCRVQSHDGMAHLAAGFGLSSLGYLILPLTPDDCTDPAQLDRCPFPRSFNHNAIFHIFVNVGVVLNFLGAMRAAQEMQKEGVVEED